MSTKLSGGNFPTLTALEKNAPGIIFQSVISTNLACKLAHDRTTIASRSYKTKTLLIDCECMGRLYSMWKDLPFWNQQEREKFHSLPTAHGSTESESHLLPKESLEEPLQISPRQGGRISKLTLGAFIIFVWTFVVFYVGFIAAGRRGGEHRWGSYEHGFVEERVVSKYKANCSTLHLRLIKLQLHQRRLN